uniref:glycerophosphocholine cholinephosphodiesterase n=1 Tax=Eptatretus burgeri TaxID=7764 RepID=A0A8C4NLQ9_EPTBU
MCALQWKSLQFGPSFYLGLLLLCNHLSPGLSKDPHPLLLIFAEGLSEVYLGEENREKLTGLREMAMRGVLARGLMPVFPTLFYPNYYSLFTGQVDNLQGTAAMAAVYYDDVALAIHENKSPLALQRLRLDVNLVLVSDHGMMDIDFDEKVIELENYIPAHFIKKQMDKGATVNLWTKDGHENEVYQLLKDLSNMTVFKRNEVPERFHYGGGRFVSPLTLLANEGWFITWNRAALPHWKNGGDGSLAPNRGCDGYDNALLSMQAVLLASGPDFKQSYIAPPLHAVDVYPLLCNLTGVSPLPHNGSWEKVNLLLSSSFGTRTSSWLMFWAMGVWMCLT